MQRKKECTPYDAHLSTTASLSYDEFARLTQHTDNQGYQLRYEYDSMNRVTKVTDHTSKDTEYAYDLMGRTATVTYDPSGANRVTTYTYDANSNTAVFKGAKAGRFRSCRKLPFSPANNYKSSYTYDSGNRTTQQKIQNSASPPVTQEQFDYSYSPGGLPSNTFGYSRTESVGPRVFLIAFDRANRIRMLPNPRAPTAGLSCSGRCDQNNGTSASEPHVSAVAGLLSHFRDYPPNVLKQKLIDGGEPSTNSRGLSVSARAG